MAIGQYLLRPSTIVAIISFAGVVISYFTIQQFRLRHWKMSASFFLAAMFIYTVFKLLSPFLEGPFLILGVEMKIAFALIIALGIYQLKQTAEQVGA